MRLVTTLLVRDEADVVAATIEHQLDQGSAVVIVTDNGSVDGTVDILREYAEAGVVDLHHEPQQDYRQSAWVTRMARRAATHFAADWVINADADEFWLAKDAGLRLADVLAGMPAAAGTVIARRVNLVGPPGDGQDWADRLVWRDLYTLSERGTPLGPKACHRADPDALVPQGNHGALGPLVGPPAAEEPLEILHVPFRSWSQVEQKTRNGGTAYAANTELAEDVGWHWRADYRRLQAGRLRQEYLRRSVTDDEASVAAQYRRDPFLAQHLRRLVTRAVLPHRLAAVMQKSGART